MKPQLIEFIGKGVAIALALALLFAASGVCGKFLIFALGWGLT